MTRTKIIYLSMMIFTPLFLGVLFFLSPNFNYLDSNSKLIAFFISIILIELILVFVFIYTNKRIDADLDLSIRNKSVQDIKKYWWVYLIIIITIPTIIIYWSYYERKLFENFSYLVQTLAGAYFIIKKPISKSGIVSPKVEFVAGVIMLVTSAVLIIKEIFV